MLGHFKALDRRSIFPCDLLTTDYHKQVLVAFISLATSDIPCTCNDASAMVYLQLFTCDDMLYKLSLESS